MVYYVATIQKCHRLCKAEVSPKALTVAKPDRAETSHIAALAGFAGQGERTFALTAAKVSKEPKLHNAAL